MSTLPNVITGTGLWRNTLAPRGGGAAPTSPVVETAQAEAARERLRSVFTGFRERAALLAGEIHRDLPDFTVHDISHIDALWEMADIIAGPDYPLTPLEAFVLGGAILLHDLGMAVASQPGGIAGLSREEVWADVVTAEFRDQSGRVPTPEEVQTPPEPIRRAATASVLRNLHAKNAERLAFASWSPRGEARALFFIEDDEVRQAFGRIIGLIAHSHWWPVSRLNQEFSRTLGAPHWCPNDWIIDPLKIACLLRAADAAHIDARRAPSFLRALRQPASGSDSHWKFQEKLQKPHLSGDALAYTSGFAFPLSDASSWWLCLDALTLIDRELRAVDVLLSDQSTPRLAARRVAAVDTPERLVSYIPTEGWLPVDAHLQVSDVPRLVMGMGGQELYGANPSVPLRELIQNASDAIRARRLIEQRGANWGEILVRLGRDEPSKRHPEGQFWLEVEDDGIGMSRDVLTRYLLDFGTSYWGSSAMVDEFPGLLASGMKATGRYGIGFFSVFMLGKAVQVRTRRSDAALQDTLVLEFNTGLSARPILRPADKSERIRDGGTRVRVWLEELPYWLKEDDRTLGESDFSSSLEGFCANLCPALDVNLSVVDATRDTTQGAVQTVQQPSPVIEALDWLQVDGAELLRRIHRENYSIQAWQEQQTTANLFERIGDNLRILRNRDGQMVGRACIADMGFEGHRLQGVVTVGGFQASGLQGVVGVLLGESERAARDVARPLVTAESLAQWASDQSDLVPRLYSKMEEQMRCAQSIHRCGGDTRDLPIARRRNEWLSRRQIAESPAFPDEVLLVDGFRLMMLDQQFTDFQLLPQVLVVDTSMLSAMFTSANSHHGGFPVSWPDSLFLPLDGGRFNSNTLFRWTLGAVVLKAIAENWQVPVESVMSFESEERTLDSVTIGRIGDKEIKESAVLLKRPI